MTAAPAPPEPAEPAPNGAPAPQPAAAADAALSPARPRCFVVSPIGGANTDVRRRADQVLKYVIEDVLVPRGYEVSRADRISDAGLITSQLLDRIVSDELVIADLTDANPNVFYELAVRHALGKPFIQLCKQGQDLPFDVQGQRTIFFDHTDLDSVADAKREIERALDSLKGVERVETPLSVTVDLLALRTSGDPEKKMEAQLLDMLQRLDSRVGRLASPRQLLHTRADESALRGLLENIAAQGYIDVDEARGLITQDTSERHDGWVTSHLMAIIERHQRRESDDPWAAPPAGWSDEPPF